MRLEALTVVLRPRSAWEAVELGTMLVRRHAGAIWRPWCLVTLPVLALLLALGGALGHPALAMLPMWWLKPLFDRIPLYVLSRAVFGEVPGWRETLGGAFRGGGRAMLGYLTWRRLSPARALLMPVDVLEGDPQGDAALRRSAVAGPAYGVAALALFTFLQFEFALSLGLAVSVLLFVPDAYVQSLAPVLWQNLREAPAWLQVLEAALAWVATSVIEPFYVGSGFGLYLNRRTEIEGWDIEIAFRRLRARLLQAGAAGVFVLSAVLLSGLPSPAQADGTRAPACTRPAAAADTLRTVFGRDYVADDGFAAAVDAAYASNELRPRRKVGVWKPRRASRSDDTLPPLFTWLTRLLGTAIEVLLWILVIALVVVAVATRRRWWPWLRSMAGGAPTPPDPAAERAVVADMPLPADIAAAARALRAAGQARDALALVYRAAVAAMAVATGQRLPPGTTEAQALRAARALPAGPQRAFGHVVRLWQHAAYADRPSDDATFEAMLDDAAAAFGWRR
ncbi:MAG: DUF4129 domain-containing protein [Lysobacter sp.]|nr:MAG: DUF4129 domain-containing protein [Lysobacter sp.]